jgi:hypothetical protein
MSREAALLAVSLAPAVICLIGAAALIPRHTWWFVRLAGLSLVLVNLVPGAVFLVATAAGILQPPAAIGGVLLILVGVALGWRLRQRWQPARDIR